MDKKPGDWMQYPISGQRVPALVLDVGYVRNSLCEGEADVQVQGYEARLA